MIEIGKFYIFNYPVEFTTLPDYSDHRRQKVQVVGENPLFEEDAAKWKIMAEDGWEGIAFEEELEELQ